MKKIILWLMSTLTTVVLLFGYHTSTSSSAAATAGGNASLAAPATTGTGSSTTSGSSSSASGSTSSTTGTTTTVTGTAVSTRYGPVQMKLTIANGTITAVDVLEYPQSNGKDQQINSRALPILVSETLKAQSTKIDMVSGATYTSDGYLTSLQSAIDKAGL